ncbi:MAG TPA: ATP-binding protein [Candidatus Polarisedimenticolaceae bacterium]|nr:ATP-binding protein [Candidatus Polarisedimenticolaceae bacterium]
MSKDAPRRCEFFSDELNLELDTTIAADLREIDGVVERVLAVGASMNCGVGKEFEIETALREALANAVVHGAKHDRREKIQIAVACDERRGMLIVVRDPGGGFDPESVPSPTHGQNLYRSHGRGIYLINELMDEVRFERGGAEIWMRKH